MPKIYEFVFHRFMDRKTTTQWKAYKNSLIYNFYWRFSKGKLLFAKRSKNDYQILSKENVMQLNGMVKNEDQLDAYINELIEGFIKQGVWDAV